MHTRELVELAAIVSAHGPLLVEAKGRLPPDAIEQYWTASKCRLDRWSRALKEHGDATSDSTRARSSSCPSAVEALFDEVLTSEVLTRVWSAVVCAFDRRGGRQEIEPIARSVLIGHLEARHRVLVMLVRGRGFDSDRAVRLNHIRRRCERWTDVLVGHLFPIGELREFAIDPQRAEDFAADLHDQESSHGKRAWQLLLGSLRASFQYELAQRSPNADLNARIAAAIMGCFQPELFDSTGLLRSLWLSRLTNAASDAQGMIDALLSPPEADHAESYFLAVGDRHLRRFGG